jgi:hypothetical protein
MALGRGFELRERPAIVLTEITDPERTFQEEKPAY